MGIGIVMLGFLVVNGLDDGGEAMLKIEGREGNWCGLECADIQMLLNLPTLCTQRHASAPCRVEVVAEIDRMNNFLIRCHDEDVDGIRAI